MEQMQKNSAEVKEVAKELVGWEDNKLFRTLKELTLRPGKMIADYAAGNKEPYLSPTVYFLGVAGVNAYLMSVTGMVEELNRPQIEAMRQQYSDPSFKKIGFNAEEIPDQFNSVMNFLMSEAGQKLILMPLFLFITWLVFKRFNRSFKANSWFSFYTNAHAALLSMPLVLYWYLTRDALLFQIVGLLVMFVYFAWAAKDFYKISPTTASLRVFAQLLLSVLAMALCGSIIMIALLILHLS